MSRAIRRLIAATATVLATGALAACASNSSSSGGTVTLRLGYFPNLTHASAIVGVNQGIFAKNLGSNVKLEPKTFNAGPSAIEALFSGAIDATYIGPSPTVNAFAKSKGEALRVISGATSGGASLVVKPEITSVDQLRDKKIATPQLGNTQDVALRFFLKQKGLTTTKEGGGDVKVVPQDNSTTVDAFKSGAIQGAWVPEPYATRLVQAGGKVLVDERTLWPGGKFVTTHLIVRTQFLQQHPDVVKGLLKGQVEANKLVNAEPARAQQIISETIGKLTGKPLKLSVIKDAWKSLTFTDDPLPDTLTTGAQHAVELGLIDRVDLTGLYDLGPLNEVLSGAGEPAVKQP
jgi:NitT/TauT family transport system substrate-binding protein